MRESTQHFAIGLVVGNKDGILLVMWPEHCKEKLSKYAVIALNPRCISRAW